MTGLAVLSAVMGAVVAYLQVSVPLPVPSLGHADVVSYWPVALIGGLVVLILTAAAAWLAIWAGRGGE
jgi:hypothetical protein